MLALTRTVALIYEQSANQLEGLLLGVADLRLTRRLDVYELTEQNCIRLKLNKNSFNTRFLNTPTGHSVEFESANDEDICIPNLPPIKKVQLFDFSKSGYVDLLVSAQQDGGKVQNYLIFRAGEEDFETDKLFKEAKNSIQYYDPVRLDETEVIPQVLDLYGNYLPDLIYAANGKINTWQNQITDNEAFFKCLQDGKQCFLKNEVTWENLEAKNVFLQVDLDGDCLPETYALVESKYISESDQTELKQFQNDHGFGLFDENQGFVYLTQLDKDFKPSNIRYLLGQNVSAPFVFDARYSGQLSVMFTTCRNVNCQDELSLTVLDADASSKDKMNLCVKKQPVFTRRAVSLSASPRGMPYASDPSLDRKTMFFVATESGVDSFNLDLKRVRLDAGINEITGVNSIVQIDFNTIGAATLVISTQNQTKIFGNYDSHGYFVRLAQQPDICFDNCKVKTLSFAPVNDFVPSASFKVSSALMGATQITAVCFMGQPAQAVQAPQAYMSIDAKAQYVDFLFAGIHDKWEMFEGVVPNSMVVANPFKGFKFQIFLPQVLLSEVVVGAVALLVTLFFLVTVLVLIRKEDKEDRAEKELVGKGFM